ncbi:MAG: DNA gyrase modulator [Actinomycetota bacterium]|nr:DNA gyrase modulator [Actinomycetota bacterium]
MIEKELLSRVLAEMLGGSGSFAEIYTQKNRNNSLKLEDSKIENAVSGFDLGCGLRLWRDDSIFYAYVDSVKKKDLLDAARALARISKSEASPRPIEINANQSLGDRSLVMPSVVDNDYKKNLLLKVNKVTRDYGRNIAKVSAYISDSGTGNPYSKLQWGILVFYSSESDTFGKCNCQEEKRNKNRAVNLMQKPLATRYLNRKNQRI